MRSITDRVRVCSFFVVAVILFLCINQSYAVRAAGSESSVSEKEKVDGSVEFLISDSILYIKDKMLFKANIADTGFSKVEQVRCYVQLPDGEVQFCGTADRNPAPNLEWSPKQLGLHKSWCEYEGCKSAVKEFFVVPKKWHFNHWWALQDQKWLTSALMHGKSEGWEQYTSRGVTALGWKNGFNWPGGKTADAYADYWREISDPQIKGVMIDEFHGKDEDNEIIGAALYALKKNNSDFFAAPYKDGFINPDAKEEIKGFRASDLVMMECYVCDWRGYERFDIYESALNAGLEENSIICLGLKSWITTEKELRNQIEFIRSKWPEMPGVAFFHKGSGFMMKAVDRAIYDYYLTPVLLLKVDQANSTAMIHNIGSLPAKNVNVECNYGEKWCEVFRIDRIDPQQFKQIKLPAKFDSVRIRRSPAYTVIDYKKPTDFTEADRFGSRRTEKFVQMCGDVEWKSQVLDISPNLSFNSKGEAERIIFSLPDLKKSKSVVLSFDVKVDLVESYPLAGVFLNGRSCSLGFEWQRQEIDYDLPVNVPRATFKCTWSKGFSAVEALPFGLGSEGKTYSFFAVYNPEKDTVRGVLSDKISGDIFWDTGDLVVEGAFSFDEFVCFVNSNDDVSEIGLTGSNGNKRIEIKRVGANCDSKTVIENISVFCVD